MVEINCSDTRNAFAYIVDVSERISSITSDVETIRTGLDIDSESTLSIKRYITRISGNLEKTRKNCRCLGKAGEECMHLYQKADRKISAMKG